LNKGLTCATFNWSGKMNVPIDLLIKDVIGPVTTGFASLIISTKFGCNWLSGF
jgi:hypothetical protein